MFGINILPWKNIALTKAVRILLLLFPKIMLWLVKTLVIK